MWDVIVVGSAGIDYLVRGTQLPTPGATLQGDTFQEAPGGKGANQAVAAARLGARVALVARLGDDDRGTLVVDRLADEGVDTIYIVRDQDVSTGVRLLQVDTHGHRQILTAPGANHQLQLVDIMVAAPALGDTQVVIASLEVPLGCVVAALELGRSAGALTILAPTPAAALPDDLLRLVDVLHLTADEAEVLTGAPARDRAGARLSAEHLLRRGVGAVALELDDQEDLLLWDEGGQRREQWLPRMPVARIDATGAGDAFVGALAAMLAEGRPLPNAGRFANAAAALTTTTLGAQSALPRRAAVQALLARAADA